MLGDATRILFVHAHPDDETLATGALIARLARDGRACFVLTATRGEQGAVRPGPLSALVGTPELPLRRIGELARACEVLGVAGHAFLGDPPASGRRYADSGMAWVDHAARIAGPGSQAGPDALTSADPEAVASDIVAHAREIGAEALVTYDPQGGYFHPDHMFLHAPTRTAASELGVPFWEIVSEADGEGEWHDLADELPVVTDALGSYASQLTIDGADVLHAGGQREAIRTRIGLRRVG